MSNRQIVVVVVVAGLAACCLCSFVGGLLVLSEPTETVPTEQATETPTTVSTVEPTVTTAPTVTPVNTPIVVDSERYLSCVTPLLNQGVLVLEGIIASSAVGETNPLGFCDDWYPRGLLESAAHIRDAHLLCPTPTDPCVLQGRDYVDSAFIALLDATVYMTRYCDGSDPLDITNINLAVTAMEDSAVYSTLAGQQFSTCN